MDRANKIKMYTFIIFFLAICTLIVIFVYNSGDVSSTKKKNNDKGQEDITYESRYLETLYILKETDTEYTGYSYFDIDNDKKVELIVYYGSSNSNKKIDIYTYTDLDIKNIASLDFSNSKLKEYGNRLVLVNDSAYYVNKVDDDISTYIITSYDSSDLIDLEVYSMPE